MRRIIIKEGPMVFLRDVILMEVFAAMLFYGASFLEDYGQLYRNWGLAHYLRYDLFVILLLSAFQIGYMVLLFLNWYFSHYEIHETEIVRKTGLLFRHRKAVSLSDVTSVEVYQSPLGRMMYHATLILEHNGGRVTKIKNIANFDEYSHIITDMVRAASGGALKRNTRHLIEHGENASVEFKETLRYDARKGETSREIERAAMKAIVGFLNASGGTLIIGVNDKGEITGLERDYNVLPKKNRDGFENHLSMVMKAMIGLSVAKYISVSFEAMDGKDICLVSVRRGHKPAYLRGHDGSEEFFVRVGNSSQPFTMSQAEEYIQTRWK